MTRKGSEVQVLYGPPRKSRPEGCGPGRRPAGVVDRPTSAPSRHGSPKTGARRPAWADTGDFVRHVVTTPALTATRVLPPNHLRQATGGPRTGETRTNRPIGEKGGW